MDFCRKFLLVLGLVSCELSYSFPLRHYVRHGTLPFRRNDISIGGSDYNQEYVVDIVIGGQEFKVIVGEPTSMLVSDIIYTPS
jgi:hypothetical protein